jgi:hypothetical protein
MHNFPENLGATTKTGCQNKKNFQRHEIFPLLLAKGQSKHLHSQSCHKGGKPNFPLLGYGNMKDDRMDI